MGLMNIGHFFSKQVLLAPLHLFDTDDQHRDDIERIAKTLAVQGGAPGHEWPRFVEPAETLVRLSTCWTEPR